MYERLFTYTFRRNIRIIVINRSYMAHVT